MASTPFHILGVAFLFLTACFAYAQTLPAGDPEQGERVWRKCRACHEIGPEAENRIGPRLNGVIGRRAGSVADYDYSRAMSEAGAGGLIWDATSIAEFLARPKSFIHNTRMSFAGLRREQERSDLIAFLLAQETPGAAGAPKDRHLKPDDPVLPAEMLAMEGDAEYGEYLSGACVTCHQIDGRDKGIPPIVGWPADAFMTVLVAYRAKYRDNPVMQQIAGSLNNEEIAALAAYFKQLQAAD